MLSARDADSEAASDMLQEKQTHTQTKLCRPGLVAHKTANQCWQYEVTGQTNQQKEHCSCMTVIEFHSGKLGTYLQTQFIPVYLNRGECSYPTADWWLWRDVNNFYFRRVNIF